MGIKSAVRKVVCRRVGWDLQPYGWHPRRLRTRFDPATVIDVGVADGTPELYAAFPDAYLVLVDPLHEAEAKTRDVLTRRAGTFVRAALGSSSGSVRLRVEADRHSKSSILLRTPLTAGTGPVEDRVVPLVTLDEVVCARELPGPIGLKIDVEGLELAVLRGATETLSRCQFIIVELSVAARFDGGSMVHDVMSHLALHGFFLRDILDAHRNHDGLTYIDGLFTGSASR